MIILDVTILCIFSITNASLNNCTYINFFYLFAKTNVFSSDKTLEYIYFKIMSFKYHKNQAQFIKSG